MSAIRGVLSFWTVLLLCSCGFYLPEIQETVPIARGNAGLRVVRPPTFIARRRLAWLVALATLVSVNCALAEPIYLTASDRMEKYGMGDGYTFIAPYFPKVQSKLWVSITNASTNAQNSQSSDNKSSSSSPTTPSIYFASWQKTADLTGKKAGQIRYAVSCDLTSVVRPGDTVTVSGMKPDAYNNNKTVVSVDATSVLVAADATQPPPVTAPVNGSIVASCPPVAGVSLSVTIGVTAIPTHRSYLYLSKNAFFDDSINVSLDNNGMLSGSDSSSTQEITAILGELAQTAGQVLSAGAAGAFPMEVEFKAGVAAKPKFDPRHECFTGIANLVKAGSYYDAKDFKGTEAQLRVDVASDAKLYVSLEAPTDTSVGEDGLNRTMVGQNPYTGHEKNIQWHNGLLVFYPVPARATAYCIATDPNTKKTHKVYLSAPSLINLYAASQFVNPQRDFLTGPQDTFTFNGGFIVGHKRADQSSAKTIVDTITAPIRAIVPSVSIQQSTQVQTGGGKPDQTTTTTQTTIGGSKSQ